MSDEVLCHLCCELMPAPGLEEHLTTAHGEATADAHGEEANVDGHGGEATTDAHGGGANTDAHGGEANADAHGEKLKGKELTTNTEITADLGKGDDYGGSWLGGF